MPGHDTRDFEFAEAFDLGVKRVVQSPTEERPKLPYTGVRTAAQCGTGSRRGRCVY